MPKKRDDEAQAADSPDDELQPAAGDAATRTEQESQRGIARTIRQAEEGDEVTEGDLHAVRDALAVNRLAGHASVQSIWAESPEGKQFLEEEAPRRQRQVERETEQIEQEQERMAKAHEVYERMVSDNAEATERNAEEARKINAEKSDQ